MPTDQNKNTFQKPNVDEDYLMNVISGNEDAAVPKAEQKQHVRQEAKPKEKARSNASGKIDYEKMFLTNRFPSGRSGKVVYIRPEYHERLLRIVQLTREEKTTLYSYIDNILEYHFKEFGEEITQFFNERFKPIL